MVCRDAQGVEFSLGVFNSADTQDLLTKVAMARLKSGQLKTLRRVGYMVLMLAIFGAGLFCIGRGAHVSEQVGLTVHNPLNSAAPTPIRALNVAPGPIPATPSVAADNGWTLPDVIRATLPDRLHKAAERKLFTVDYSSGHARTLYVFSDPSCPNCKRMEPALDAISDALNVVVFPVAVIGKEKSAADITPVLCLPPEQRKAAWDALFDPAHDGLNLGKQPQKQASEVDQPGECDIALKALGVNHVAYQTYQIPGTPWAITDDGRYVSQTLLRDPLKLQAFLDEQPVQKGQEVSNASE